MAGFFRSGVWAKATPGIGPGAWHPKVGPELDSKYLWDRKIAECCKQSDVDIPVGAYKKVRLRPMRRVTAQLERWQREKALATGLETMALFW